MRGGASWVPSLEGLETRPLGTEAVLGLGLGPRGMVGQISCSCSTLSGGKGLSRGPDQVAHQASSLWPGGPMNVGMASGRYAGFSCSKVSVQLQMAQNPPWWPKDN